MAQDDGQELYFRLRENGATVFHLAPSGRENRLDMAPIASVNLRNGEIKRQGGHNLSPEESDQIRAWIEARTALVARREIDDILRTVEHLNLTAHWVQTRASADDLAAVTDQLLLAMHDLRNVLVRKLSERLIADDAELEASEVESADD